MMAPRASAASAVPTYHGAILQLVVLLSAGLVGAAVSQLSWWRDPVDVVGLPLVTGYSERAEQAGFYAFMVTSVASALLLAPLLQRLERLAWSVVGAFVVLGLLCVESWSRDFNLWPLVMVGGCGSYLAGAAWPKWSHRMTTMGLLWSVGMLAWCVGYPELMRIIGSSSRSVAACAGLFAAVVSFAASRGVRRSAWLRGVLISVSVLVVAGGFLLAPFREFHLGLCGAVCVILGFQTRNSGRGFWIAATHH